MEVEISNAASPVGLIDTKNIGKAMKIVLLTRVEIDTLFRFGNRQLGFSNSGLVVQYCHSRTGLLDTTNIR